MNKILLLTVIFSLVCIAKLSGQTPSERKNIKAKTRVDSLHRFALKKDKEYRIQKAKLQKLAEKNNWVVFETDSNGNYRELADINSKGEPVYMISHNADAAKSVRTNMLHAGGSLGLNLEGQNMTVYMWGWGHGRSTHQEYENGSGSSRMIVADNDAVLNDHAAHIIGTLIASGVEAQAKGMAPQANAVVYKWNNDIFEAAEEAQNGMLISTHSYGPDAEESNDDAFGQYGRDAVDWDELMHYAPYYLMVASAGNDGNYDTYNAEPLDGNSTYDKLLGHKTAKNNLVVANAGDAEIDENGDLISVSMHSTSSEGPTDDYRIKPDITGNGTGLYSTLQSSDYGYKTGTSMASPNVAGSLLLLQQHYNNTHGNFMHASSLKGLALHTADDIGTQGPDAVSGWGLLNVKSAAQVISDHGRFSLIDERIINEGETHYITINSDGINDLEVSISWTDPPGNLNQNLNDNTPALINDLDLRITNGSTFYEPYRLTSVSAVGMGDNTVDPFEKIIVTEASDTYTITVSPKTGLSGGSQQYTLIITGILNDPPAISGISPQDMFKDRGKEITITGTGLLACEFDIDGIAGEVLFSSDSEAVVSFPPGNYTQGILTASNALGTDNVRVNLHTRHIIPVNAAAPDNDDEHESIQSALDGLYAYLGSSTYSETYTIEVAGGTYEGGITPVSELKPSENNPLIIKNRSGNSPQINAAGNDYGIDLNTLNNVSLEGFTIYNARYANIHAEGNNLIISNNQVYGASEGSGIQLETGSGFHLNNNLSYGNSLHGIHTTADDIILLNNTLADNGTAVIPKENVSLFYENFESGLSNWQSTGNIYLYPNDDPQYYVSENTSLYIYGASDLFINLAQPIDVSGYTNFSISAYLRFNLMGDIETADILRFEYSFDNTNWTEIVGLTTDDTDIYEFVKYSVEGLSPESNELYIRFYALVYDPEAEWDESWIIDDVELQGDQNFTAYGNGSALYIESGNDVQLQNNIFTAKAGNDDFFALQYADNLTVNSDYNTYFSSNSYLFNRNGTPSNTGGPTGANDIFSDPLFVNTGSDYHLQSAGGAFVGGKWPPLSAVAGSWEAQTTYSPALDAGNPAHDYSDEPAGGSAINQGAYGNTPQASKTLTVSVSAESLIICAGGETQLRAEAYGGAEPYSYSWASDPGDFTSDLVSPTVSPSQTTTYSLTVSDSSNGIIDGQINIKVLNDCILWVGGNTDWHTAGNWNPATVPLPADNVHIPVVEADNEFPVINNAESAECADIIIDENAALTVGTSGKLTVHGTLQNNNGIDGLIVKSNATGTGSLILNSSSQGTVERFLNKTTTTEGQWFFIGSPVSTAPLSMFNLNNFYFYNESVNDWWTGPDYFYDGSYGWQLPATDLGVGMGYIYYYYQTTLAYTGELNYSETGYTFNVDYTEHAGDAANGQQYNEFDGWNLFSNPNQSAIDWLQVNKTGLNNAVYYYDGTADNYVYYIDNGGSGSGANGGSQFIPAGQGFFVKADGVGGQLEIPNSARIHSEDDFFKSKKNKNTIQKNEPATELRYNINNFAGNDEGLIQFRSGRNTKAIYDGRHDAYKRFSWSNDMPQVYALSSDESLRYAITSISADATQVVSLGYKLPENGEYTIQFSEFYDDYFDYLYLEDTYEEKYIDLSKYSDYTFIADNIITDDRLKLHFGVNKAPVIEKRIEDKKVTANHSLQIDVQGVFDDSDLFDELFYSAGLSNGAKLPEWLTFDSESMLFEVNPQEDDIGVVEVILRCYDSYGADTDLTFKITVNSNENALVSIISTSVCIGKDIAVSVYAADLFNMSRFHWIIEYNAELLEYDSVSNWAEEIPDVEIQHIEDSKTGKIIFMKSDLTTDNNDSIGLDIENGKFFDLYFTAKETKGDAFVRWADSSAICEIYNTDDDLIPVFWSEGFVKIYPLYYLTSIASSEVVCPGEQLQLFANAAGGTGNYSYIWTSMPEGFHSTEANPLIFPTLNTTYYLYVSDGEHLLTDSLLVHYVEFPSIFKQPQDVITHVNTDISFGVFASGSDLVYQWQKDEINIENTTNISGAKDSLLSIRNVQETDVGNYSVIVRNDCGEIISNNAELKITTSSQILEEEKIELFPNPVSDNLNISFKTEIKNLKVSVTDIIGNVLFWADISNSNTFKIDMSNFSRGAYFVKLHAESKIYIYKVIKK